MSTSTSPCLILNSICRLLVWRRSTRLSQLEILYHAGNTAWGPVGIVIAHIASFSPLHLLYGFGVLLSIRVPDCRCTFHCWSYNCGICSCFYRCGALFKVPSQEAQSPISFHDHAVNMLVPVHIFVQRDAKVLAGIFRLRVMSMYMVCCLYKTFLLGMMCMTEHLVALKLICQVFSQTSRASRSCWSKKQSCILSIVLNRFSYSCLTVSVETGIGEGRGGSRKTVGDSNEHVLDLPPPPSHIHITHNLQ